MSLSRRDCFSLCDTRPVFLLTFACGIASLMFSFGTECFFYCYCSLLGVTLWIGSKFGSLEPLYAAAAALTFATCGTYPSPSIESTNVFKVVMLGSAGRSFFVLFSFIMFWVLPDYLTCYCSKRSFSWFANWKSTWFPWATPDGGRSYDTLTCWCIGDTLWAPCFMFEVIGVLLEGVGAGDGESPALRICFMLFCGVARALPIG